jgi:hypothetical protein
MTKMKNLDVLNVYSACETLLDKDIEVSVAFRLADVITKLDAKRSAIRMAAQTIPKDENGNPDSKEWEKLMSLPAEIDVGTFTREELTSAFEKVNVRSILALMPIIKD